MYVCVCVAPVYKRVHGAGLYIYTHMCSVCARREGHQKSLPFPTPAPKPSSPVVIWVCNSRLEIDANIFQLPVTWWGSSDKKMCLFISKYFNYHQFHMYIEGEEKAELNLKDT